MITFTKEQLIASANARIEFAEMMLAGELEPLKERTWSIELELARIALASLEAEPAGYHIIIEGGAVGGYVATLKEAEETRDLWNKSWTIKPYFYADPPAPVYVPDEWNKSLQEMVDAMRQYEMDVYEDAPYKHRAMMRRAEELLGKRAAMLHGADGNSPVIPDDLYTVCADAYQVFGVMADALGIFDDVAVQKVMDNLSQQKLVHSDVLPFSLPAAPQQEGK